MNLSKSYDEIGSFYFISALNQEEKIKNDLCNRNGNENVFLLHKELSDLLIQNVTVVRNNKDLDFTLQSIERIKERYNNISINDSSLFANQSYVFANQFSYMLDLSLAITKGALLRNEFRGAHYKPEYPGRDDTHFLKTTIASYTNDGPKITYEDVDIRHIKPILRDYTRAEKIEPIIENIPKKLPLPL